jgi:hypothetical protein
MVYEYLRIHMSGAAGHMHLLITCRWQLLITCLRQLLITCLGGNC